MLVPVLCNVRQRLRRVWGVWGVRVAEDFFVVEGFERRRFFQPANIITFCELHFITSASHPYKHLMLAARPKNKSK